MRRKRNSEDAWLSWSEHKSLAACDIKEHFNLMSMLYDVDNLWYAAVAIDSAAEAIIPDVPDVKSNPIPVLESIEVDPVGPIELQQVVKQIFGKLKMIEEVWPHPEAVKSLKSFAEKLVVLLWSVRKLGQKKIALANVMNLHETAKKFQDAYKKFCIVELTEDGHEDARRLFVERRITPDEFKNTVCSAFRLDSVATKEINSFENKVSPSHVLNAPKTKTAVLRKGRGKKRTAREIDENKKKNALIVEIRRRAKSAGGLGCENIKLAYERIEKESLEAGSKWNRVMSLAPKKTILDMARHNRHYKVK